MDNESQFPIPKKEDVLFASDKSIWKMDAILDFRPGNDYTYRQGYRRAGRILAEYVASHGEVDFLVFPICHGYGMPDSDSQKPSKSHMQTLERLEKLAKRFSNLVLTKVDSHAKVLLQDELFVVLGSFNWLSFRGDPDRAFRDEQSALVALPSMVERKFQSELKLFI